MRPDHLRKNTHRTHAVSPTSAVLTRATRRLLTWRRVALTLGAVGILAAIIAVPAMSAVAVRHQAPSGEVVQDTCTPQTYTWTFDAADNYAAPSPGDRYEKSKDGCQSVWYVGTSGTVTLNVHVAETKTHGAYETFPTICEPNVVCQLWESAENNVKFYIREPESKVVASGTIRF